MSATLQSSPHLHGNASVTRVMYTVLLALVPVVAAYIWLWGSQVLWLLLWAGGTALIAEAVVLVLRKLPLKVFLRDGSALVTALLIVLCLPPTVPPWVVVVGVLFAIVVAKHLYGGLGYNLFNPAMAGYLVVLVAFPAQLSLWPVPDPQPYGGEVSLTSDSTTMATPLDKLRTNRLQGKATAEAMTASPLFGVFPNGVTAMLALAWAAGGLLLLVTGTIHWRIPLAVLLALGLFSGLAGWLNPVGHAGALFHLFSGGTMAAAFFIATDPVSAATTPRGQIIYGLGIGLLIYLIRAWGGYPDGVAFAVLLMNICAPLIDYFTVPRAYGE
ncbi:MAG: RnfABCDGE type electron transport complex subunit D [Immundisolibacteraceae bacterium]|nr:RnfABCDGE type electron transport complex subunit D [Immundisolibacteraceae bacterium]